ncbi:MULTISPECIES: restriction endonuclease subunit S, partial [Acetobacteraceae]|uniref:restriction endonuclease subunit S n=1 Tax=Acetobacteraceae TaxID=433 RepID=UPI0039EA28E8
MKLADVIDIRHGFAFRGEFFSDSPTGFILATPGNFAIGGGFRSGKAKYYNGPVPDEYCLSEGDIIVTMTDLSKDADTLGYSASVPASANTFLHNQRIGKIVPKGNINLRFIYWLMRTPAYRDEILASYTGSTVKHTSPSRILSFQFDCPSLEDQGRIASILDILDNKIDLNCRTNETLEAMARALFQDWFVGFGPTRAKMAGQAAYLAPEIWKLFPDRLDDEEKPEGWTVEPVDNVASFLNGLALQKYPAGEGAFLPAIKIAQLRSESTHSADRVSVGIPCEYVVEEGDILFSWSGSLLCKFWNGERGALNQHLFKVTSGRFPDWFVFEWIQHYMPDFQAIAESKATTMGHIQRHHLTESLVTIPSSCVMKQADLIIGSHIRKIKENHKESRNLSELRDLLLPRLMSGEIRIRDAGKMVEDAL